MEAIVLAFALGAGTVVAATHGRRLLHRAVGLAAETAGYVTARVAGALEEKRRIARQHHEQGRRP